MHQSLEKSSWLKTFSLRLDNEEQAATMKDNLRGIGAPVTEIVGGFQTEDPAGMLCY